MSAPRNEPPADLPTYNGMNALTPHSRSEDIAAYTLAQRKADAAEKDK